MRNYLLFTIFALSINTLAQIPTTGLVGYYPFNNNANDASGNENNGTVNGATLTTDRFGNENSAYSFDGVNDYITINNASSNLQFSGDFSICAWINFSGGIQNPRIVSHDQFNGYEFLTLGTGTVRQLRLHYGTQDITSIITIVENTWYFVCVVKSGNSIIFYANGIEDNQANVISSIASYAIPNPEIGRKASEVTDYYGGKIDDICMYNRGLDPVEINSLYNEESCYHAITIQPQDQALTVCSQANFTINTSGSSPLTYQWYKNGTAISGAINSSFVTPTLTLEDDGNTYYCEIVFCQGEFEVISNTATLSVVSPCTFLNPKIILNESVLSPGEDITFNGLDFTPYGTTALSITNELGEDVGMNSPLENSSSGSFLCTLPITIDFIDGSYTANAIDISTGKIAPLKTFIVENYSPPELWITNPLLGDQYITGQEFQITWGEFGTSTNVTNVSGHIQTSHKIEFSNNNGASWYIVKSAHITDINLCSQNNSYSYSYAVNMPGNYQIRITDNDNSSLSMTSNEFIVSDPGIDGFSLSYHWDQSCPASPLCSYPVGLAADGTSRILLILDRAVNNPKEIESINATIKPVNSNQTGIDTLGKIILANNPFNYSLEGNNANSINYFWEGNPNICEIYFWLVAPDDFTHNENDQRSEREINVEFQILYTDNTTEIVSTINRPIKIVRPPLVLVHGLGGDRSSFIDSKYKLGNDIETKHFNRDIKNNQIEYNTPWKVSQRLGLYPFDSFENNAKLILGETLDPDKYYNTFQAHINAMRDQGFACNRVDFVAHSMGGCIARDITNSFPSLYKYIPNDPHRHKNYEKGFINKLITISTPHNGSYFADFVIDRVPNSLLYFFPGLKNSIKFIENGIVPPAIQNLQSHSGGNIFYPSLVKNHLIGSDIDHNNNKSEFEILLALRWLSNDPFDIGLSSAYEILTPFPQSIGGFISNTYQNDEFLSETDYVVQVSSQFPNSTPQEISTVTSHPQSSSSIIYGPDKSHLGIQNNLVVGTRIMRLLNSPINSDFFAESIAGNPSNFTPPSQSKRVMPMDSVIYYFDSTYIDIITPFFNDTIHIDSTLITTIHLSDTNNLQTIRVIFYDVIISSANKDTIQYFMLPTSGKPLGPNLIIAEAIYDSLGTKISHIDTVTACISSNDSAIHLQASPISNILNPDQTFEPKIELVFSTSINKVTLDYMGLDFIIADTNVIVFDSSNLRFITKDTGSTFIIFTYLTLSDTIFIYLTNDYDNFEFSSCANDTLVFFAGFLDTTKSYQWQIDTLDTFYNIDSSINYDGIHSPYLIILTPPSEWYGLRYRCVISDSIGSTISKIYTLKFGLIWEGTIDSLWENPANWSCSILPDHNSDVIIPAEVPNYPIVSSNVYCRSLRLKPGASVEVNTGFQLTTTGGNEP